MNVEQPRVGALIIGREGGETWWAESILLVTYASTQMTVAITLAQRTDDRPTWAADGTESVWCLSIRPWRRLSDIDLSGDGLAQVLAEFADEHEVVAVLLAGVR
jgi:hypothetical protein